MAIDVMQKLALQSELVDIFNRIETAGIMEKLTMQTRLLEIWELLGVGDSNAGDSEVVAEQSLVQRFLAGQFDGSPSGEFIDVLTDISPEVGTAISLQQVIDHSNQWWEKTGINEYKARAGE